jgi:hypothetical protein
MFVNKYIIIKLSVKDNKRRWKVTCTGISFVYTLQRNIGRVEWGGEICTGHNPTIPTF